MKKRNLFGSVLLSIMAAGALMTGCRDQDSVNRLPPPAQASQNIDSFNKSSSTYEATMSEMTRKLLGNDWAEKITSWSNMNVLVLSEKDFNDAEAKALANAPVSVSALFGARDEGLMQQKADYFVNKYPSIDMSEINVVTLSSMFDAAYHGEPVSLSFPTNGSKEFNQCIVTMPSKSWSSDEYFSALAAISKYDVENVPQNRKAWQTFVMIHEAHHCKEDFEKVFRDETVSDNDAFAAMTSEEVNADQFSLHILEDLIEQGYTEFEGVADALVAARAIGVFNRTLETHIAGGALILSHPTPPQVDASGDEMLDAVGGAMIYLFTDIAQDYVKPRHEGGLMLYLLRQNNLEKDIRYTRLEAAISNDNNDGTIIDAINAFKTEEKLWGQYKYQNAMLRMSVGLDITREAPHLFYQVATKQLAAGVFDDNPLRKRYVERALEGYDKYAPDLVKAEAANKKPSTLFKLQTRMKQLWNRVHVANDYKPHYEVKKYKISYNMN